MGNGATLKPARAGEVRNPVGRPKGSRNKLSEKFLSALYDDFQKHGAAAIEKARAERPAEYLKIVAGLLPKELVVTEQPFDEMTDGELVELLCEIRSLSEKAKALN